MRALALICIMSVVCGVQAGCDSGTGLDDDAVTGRVLMPDGEAPPVGSPVYALANLYGFGSHTVIDSTTTGAHGWFVFTETSGLSSRLVAGVRGPGARSTWSHVSPLSDWLPDASPVKDDDRVRLVLQVVESGAAVQGNAREFVEADVWGPAENAEIGLWWLEGPSFVKVDSTRADAAGAYAFADVLTGLYVVRGETDGSVPFSGYDETEPIFASPTAAAVADTLWLTDLFVDKPAIYIYPETPGPFEVRLDLGGGRADHREPARVRRGLVRDRLRGRPHRRRPRLSVLRAGRAATDPAVGRLVSRRRASGRGARRSGRSDRTERPRGGGVRRLLVRAVGGGAPIGRACPVFDAALDGWAALDVTPVPDVTLRAWVIFAPLDVPIDLPVPVVPEVERRGTTVIEWGGAVLPRPLT